MDRTRTQVNGGRYHDAAGRPKLQPAAVDFSVLARRGKAALQFFQTAPRRGTFPWSCAGGPESGVG